jgi:microcystin-dependent protein
MYDPHVAPPTPVQGGATTLREGVVQTVNADGTVDLKATDSRTGWTQMTPPGWYSPTVGDHVLVADLQGDPQQAVIVVPITGTLKAQTTADVAAPTGAMLVFSGSSAPTGWQLCDGSDAATTALDTFLKAQTPSSPHGLNGGTGKAKVPDMRGRTPVGVGTATGAAGATAHTLGQKSGEEKHQLSVGELAQHKHNARFTGSNNQTFTTIAAGGYVASSDGNTGQGGPNGWAIGDDLIGSNTPHENMPPYVGLNYIIKT